MRPLQYLGNISYSLYLWHWPLYVIFGYYFNGRLSNQILLEIIILSLVLASISYYFIEEPFRQKQQYWSNKRLVYTFCFVVYYYIPQADGSINSWRSQCVPTFSKSAQLCKRLGRYAFTKPLAAY